MTRVPLTQGSMSMVSPLSCMGLGFESHLFLCQFLMNRGTGQRNIISFEILLTQKYGLLLEMLLWTGLYFVVVGSMYIRGKFWL